MHGGPALQIASLAHFQQQPTSFLAAAAAQGPAALGAAAAAAPAAGERLVG